MTASEKMTILRQERVFASFPDADLTFFLDRCEELILEAGAVLTTEGNREENFFILLRGRLVVYKAKRLVCELHPVDYVGLMSAIDGEARSATVKSVAACQLLRVPFALFASCFTHRPESLLSLMKIFSRRIRLDNEALAREFTQTNVFIHDMKNLLSVFQLLDNLPAADEAVRQRYLHFMKMARNNLTSLVEQSLATMKNFVTPHPAGLHSLQEMIREMVESDCVTHPDLKDKRIVVNLSRDIPDFPFSKLQIRRVLLNLLVNAAQASPAGAAIELLVQGGEDQAVIEVRDRGCGIPTAVADKVFEAHFTTKEEGCGLGLLSCRQIVEKEYGGTISFVSDPLQGTVFTVSLPVRRERSEAHSPAMT
ncbi:MAG: ATP-binding protein [Thermodesulfobacteriota bacterium]